jgi:molybdopterin converting factor small subunit
MKILFFAQAREAAGCDHCHVKLPMPLVPSGLWGVLIQSCPALAPFQKTARLARNGAYLLPDEMIQPDDEIAVIPPVSGG